MITRWNLVTAVGYIPSEKGSCPGQMKCIIHPIDEKQTSVSLFGDLPFIRAQTHLAAQCVTRLGTMVLFR